MNAQITEMNILKNGNEMPITLEMISAVLAKLAQGSAEPQAMCA